MESMGYQIGMESLVFDPNSCVRKATESEGMHVERIGVSRS